MPLALPLADATWLAQSADLVGVSGLGAVLLGTAVATAGAARRRTRGSVLAAGPWLAAVAALCVYGSGRVSVVERARDRAGVLRVALIQPAIPATLRWRPEMAEPIRLHLQRLSESVLGRSPDVIVWHEGAYPYRLPYRAGQDGMLAPFALPERHVGRWPALVFGSVADGVHGAVYDGSVYNATFVRAPDGSLGRPVAKRVLVPFGEYVPLVRLVPFVGRWFRRAEGLTPGERPEVLMVAGRSLGVLNCFEDTIPWAGADVASADLLVNTTNDAWFDGAAGEQHLYTARWRAIETRRDMVRAVNTGLSSHIDASGRVVTVLPPGLPAADLVFPRVGIGLHPLAPRVIVMAPWVALAGLGAALSARAARRWR